MPKLSMTLGRNIERILNEKGLSQTEFAKQLGVTFKTINTYISGKSGISLGMISKMAETLGVEETDLTTPKDHPTTQEISNDYENFVRQARSNQESLKDLLDRLSKTMHMPSEDMRHAWIEEWSLKANQGPPQSQGPDVQELIRLFTSPALNDSQRRGILGHVRDIVDVATSMQANSRIIKPSKK